MFAVRLLYWCVLTCSKSSSGVEEVVFQMSPDQEEETLHTGRTEADLQGLAGDHLVQDHPPHHHRGQLDLRVDLDQPHQLGDGKRLERGQSLLVVVVDVPEAHQQQAE